MLVSDLKPGLLLKCDKAWFYDSNLDSSDKTIIVLVVGIKKTIYNCRMITATMLASSKIRDKMIWTQRMWLNDNLENYEYTLI